MEQFLRDRVECYDLVVGNVESEIPEKVKFKNRFNALRILHKHIINNSVIIIHGDVDVDGIGATYISRKFLETQKATKVNLCINKEKIHGVFENQIDYFNNGNDLVIILDSSSNNQDVFKKLNGDVIVIDHHAILHTEYTGNTVNGEYVIINNMIDNEEEGYIADSKMSGALVVYELLRWYQSEYCNDINYLHEKMLYQWVGVTLLTDAIPTGNARNQWYMDNTVNNTLTESGLSQLMKGLSKWTKTLSKTFINFTLAPTFNRAIRAGYSTLALDIAIYRPYEIEELKVFRAIQDGIITYIKAALADKNARESMIESEKLDRERLQLVMQNIFVKENFVLVNLSNWVDKSYNGLIATKIMDHYGKTTVAFILNKDEEIEGSFRGRYNDIDYRAYIENKGFFAQGHDNAFGLKINVHKTIEVMTDVVALEDNTNKQVYLTAGNIDIDFIGKHHIFDMDQFRRDGNLYKLAVANSTLSTRESVSIVVSYLDITEVEEEKYYKTYTILGLKCKAFSTLNSKYIEIYVEYDGDIKMYAREFTS